MLDQAGRVIETILFFLLMLLWVVIATVDRAIETNSILHPPFLARATLSFVYQGERYDFSRIDMMRKKAFPSGDSGWQLDHSQITVPLHDGSALIAQVQISIFSPILRNGLVEGRETHVALGQWYWIDNLARPTRIVEANFTPQQLEEHPEKTTLIEPKNMIQLTLERLDGSAKNNAVADARAYASEVVLDHVGRHQKFFTKVDILGVVEEGADQLRQLNGWSVGGDDCKILPQFALSRAEQISVLRTAAQFASKDLTEGRYLGSSVWTIDKRTYSVLMGQYYVGTFDIPPWPARSDYLRAIELSGKNCDMAAWDNRSRFAFVDFGTAKGMFEVSLSAVRTLLAAKDH